VAFRILASLRAVSQLSMKHYSPHFKHNILTSYSPNTRGFGFKSLAKRYGIAGGHMTVSGWYRRWDGTAASLQRRQGSGRPTLLNPTQVAHHITGRIRRKNRKNEGNRYEQVATIIRKSTGKNVALRTIRRYGLERAGIKKKRTKKRTQREGKLAHICTGLASSHLPSLT
jgi:transposase